MLVHLIRHGSAGRKGDTADDARRPLDEEGRAQAHALCRSLASEPLIRLRSSPASRCVDTLQPLASMLGLPIELVDELAVDAPPTGLVRLVTTDAVDGDVVCAHGEAMATLLRRLRADGLGIDPDPGDDALLAKGVCWRLSVHDGRITALRPTNAPAVSHR